MHIIQDYLNTQGLHLDTEQVSIARLAAQTVMEQGQAVIEHSVLWYQTEQGVLNQYLEDNEFNTACLKKIYMALDSVASRHLSISAVVYGVLEDGTLIRLAQQGQPIETILSPNAETINTHLPVRTACNGWLNLMHNTQQWLKNGDISGSFNLRSATQASFPICNDTGSVYGVIHIEHKDIEGIDAAAQIDWIGLALALSPVLQTLLPRHNNEEQE